MVWSLTPEVKAATCLRTTESTGGWLFQAW
jgi:hypothetical protein